MNVGKVFVGGTEQNIDGSADTPPFKGCIQVRGVFVTLILPGEGGGG